MGGVAKDLDFRRLVHQVTEPGLLARLDAGDMTFYAGFDPTAPSLHVGNLLQLCTLRRLQSAGHRPIALVGGGTGAIGDPGGKAEERVLQSRQELEHNRDAVAEQVVRFLDLEGRDGAKAAQMVDNAQWLGSMGVLEFLREVGKHFTVNQMVAKESVRSRLERPDRGISYTEFSYMLLQAYDFLRLHDDWGCQLQLGGSDQWGNITMGVDLVRRVRQREVFGLTTPLVTKADGTKFGKTEQGTLWLDRARTSPYRLYQFFVQTEDAVVGDYLRYFTFLSHAEIEDLDIEVRQSPKERAAQRALAHQVTSLVHGIQEANQAEAASRALFEGSVAALDALALEAAVVEIPSTTLGRTTLGSEAQAGMTLVEALVLSGLVRSRAEGRRMVAQGGIYLNDRRQEDPEAVLSRHHLLHDRYVVLRRGRSRYHVLKVG